MIIKEKKTKKRNISSKFYESQTNRADDCIGCCNVEENVLTIEKCYKIAVLHTLLKNRSRIMRSLSIRDDVKHC